MTDRCKECDARLTEPEDSELLKLCWPCLHALDKRRKIRAINDDKERRFYPRASHPENWD